MITMIIIIMITMIIIIMIIMIIMIMTIMIIIIMITIIVIGASEDFFFAKSSKKMRTTDQSKTNCYEKR
jgi:hypothetical protein